jgi:hypothetical protein
MSTNIKITAFTDIGNNIAPTTLVPVVDMAGPSTTKKANLQNVGNLILNGAGGSNFVPAARAILSQSVTNAAQPNITSTGTLTSLTVAGNANVGNIGATNFVGGGGSLTNLNANNISSGTVSTARLGTGTANANTYLAGDNTWKEITGGGSADTGDITFVGTTISAPDESIIVIEAKDENGAAAARLTLDPDESIAKLESLADDDLSFFPSNEFSTAEWTVDQFGNGVLVFSDARDLYNFIDGSNTAWDRGTSRTFSWNNGDQRVEYTGYSWNDEMNRLTLNVGSENLPPVDPTEVTVLTLNWTNLSRISVDGLDNERIEILGRGIPVNINTTDRLNVDADQIRLYSQASDDSYIRLYAGDYVRIRTNDYSGGPGRYEWEFQDNGSLRLPDGGIIREDEVTENPTIELTPADPDVGSQKLVIKGGFGDDYHLHLTTGDLTETSVIVGTDEHNIRTTVDGGAQITSYDYFAQENKNWYFDPMGDLSLPGNLIFSPTQIQSSAYSGGQGHQMMIDTNRTDEYEEIGSADKPFKTFAAAITAVAAVNPTGTVPYTFVLMGCNINEDVDFTPHNFNFITISTTCRAVFNNPVTFGNSALKQLTIRNVEFGSTFTITGDGTAEQLNNVSMYNTSFSGAVNITATNATAFYEVAFFDTVNLTNLSYLYINGAQFNADWTITADSDGVIPSRGIDPNSGGSIAIVFSTIANNLIFVKGGTAAYVFQPHMTRIGRNAGIYALPAGWTLVAYSSVFIGTWTNNGTWTMRNSSNVNAIAGVAPTYAGTIGGSTITASGNITGGNIITGGNVAATRVQNDANLEIRSNVAGVAKVWTFDSLGDINLPVGGNISGSGYVTALRIITDPVPLANLTAVAGGRAFVSDGNLVATGNFGAQIGSGGSNTVPVWSDGTNWYIG